MSLVKRAAWFDRRSRLGQFFTPRVLVDHICAWVIRTPADTVLDPTCGEGDFLLGAVDRLRALGAVKPIVHGVDIDRAVLSCAQDRVGPEVFLRHADFLSCEPTPFDAIVGNFPYVRQETLGPAYKEALRRVLAAHPPEDVEGLTGQADLYVYLVLHAERFLRPGGRMGVVVSNAWLDVDYGRALRRFFLRRFREVTVVESRREAWFQEPTINPVVLLLEKGEGPARTRFVQVECPLSDVAPGRFDGPGCRVREARVGDTDRWGIPLRAPQVFLELASELAGATVPLRGGLAEIERGVTPGVVDFFYVDRETADRHGIERRYLVPVVRSLREARGVTVRREDLTRALFVCPDDPDRLARDGLGALRHILWGTLQETRAQARGKLGGMPYPLVSSLRARSLWYDVGKVDRADFLLNRFIGDRHLVPSPPHGAAAGDVFFAGRFRNGVDRPLALAILNSAIVFLWMEVLGRKTWRQGVLYFYGPEVDALRVPDPSRVCAADRRRILAAFGDICRRDVGPFPDECRRADRIALDDAVLTAIGLDPSWRERIYAALVDEIVLRTRILPGKAAVGSKSGGAETPPARIAAGRPRLRNDPRH